MPKFEVEGEFMITFSGLIIEAETQEEAEYAVGEEFTLMDLGPYIDSEDENYVTAKEVV